MSMPPAQSRGNRPDRSREAVARRRELLQAAMHESEMEGTRARDPGAAAIKEAYVAGDLTTEEMIAALDERYKPER